MGEKMADLGRKCMRGGTERGGGAEVFGGGDIDFTGGVY